jgi:hypothetical protein
MLHTSGLCFESFSEDDLKYRTAKGIPTVVSSSFASIRTVTLHDLVLPQPPEMDMGGHWASQRPAVPERRVLPRLRRFRDRGVPRAAATAARPGARAAMTPPGCRRMLPGFFGASDEQ